MMTQEIFKELNKNTKKGSKNFYKPLPDDDRILWPDNEAFFEMLGDTLSGLDNPISIEVG